MTVNSEGYEMNVIILTSKKCSMLRTSKNQHKIRRGPFMHMACQLAIKRDELGMSSYTVL